jgi:hypothetical protein
MARGLTLEDERQMLDEIRGWQVGDEHDVDQLLMERLGVAWLDQFRAARDEVAGTLRELGGTSIGASAPGVRPLSRRGRAGRGRRRVKAGSTVAPSPQARLSGYDRESGSPA